MFLIPCCSIAFLFSFQNVRVGVSIVGVRNWRISSLIFISAFVNRSSLTMLLQVLLHRRMPLRMRSHRPSRVTSMRRASCVVQTAIRSMAVRRPPSLSWWRMTMEPVQTWSRRMWVIRLPSSYRLVVRGTSCRSIMDQRIKTNGHESIHRRLRHIFIRRNCCLFMIRQMYFVSTNVHASSYLTVRRINSMSPIPGVMACIRQMCVTNRPSMLWHHAILVRIRHVLQWHVRWVISMPINSVWLTYLRSVSSESVVPTQVQMIRHRNIRIVMPHRNRLIPSL